MNNRILGLLLAVVVVLGLIFWVGSKQLGDLNLTPQNGSTSPPSSSQGTSRLVIAAKASGNNPSGITALRVTIDQLEAQRGSDWKTLTSDDKTFDLIQLKQSAQPLVYIDQQVDAGTYNNARLTIGKVEVVSGNKTQEAFLPARVITLEGNYPLAKDKTIAVLIDFQTNKSLIKADDKYVLAPVVTISGMLDPQVNKQNDQVTYTGGTTLGQMNFGMNENGDFVPNFTLTKPLQVDAQGKVTVKGATQANNKSITVNLTAQNNSGVSGTAVLTEADGKITIKVTTSGGASDKTSASEPAHIHKGSCPNPGAIEYGLSPVVNNTSSTTILTNLAALKTKAPLAINVHKSENELSTYIACGNITF